jgi:starch phosphorylase
MAVNPVLSLDGTNGYDALKELALDLRWSWNHATDSIWQQIDPEMWETTQNPWVILRNTPAGRIRSLFAQPAFAKLVKDMIDKRRLVEQTPAWFQRTHPSDPVGTIAYFSMEFMLSEALPIYAGGLGNVAADQLKTASDLGVPVIGVGLLYAQGYFRQQFDADGNQEAVYPFNDPDLLPVQAVRDKNGDPLRLQLDLPGCKLWLRTWEVKVGRTKLYLLDSNDPANLPAHRCITSELYGGGPELRLKQEIILGIGGWRLLRALGIDPEVCHLNEGHAAFAAVERARCFSEATGKSFAAALVITRIGNIFTTHTAVVAGFDRFAPELIEKYLSAYAVDELGIPIDEFLALGRCDAEDRFELFNMAYLAVHTSGAVCAVSSLHEQVSRKIFQPLFPRWPEAEVPIGHVTNGIHVPTWDSAAADAIWTEAAGKERWLGDLHGIEAGIHNLSDSRIWSFRADARQTLMGEVRKEYARHVAEQGGTESDSDAAAANLFDANALTMGFARRFATYKRPDLLLHDPERLVRLLTNHEHPVQLMLAGKAHPDDHDGQALIKRWNEFARRPEVRSRVMFLCDYDMMQAQRLVQGCDLWINTPLRPWEASGTSGMKVLANGGLNLSELDGWWAEAYTPEVGWAIGDRREHGADPAIDAADADALYTLLEQQIIPEYYDRNAKGIPGRWVMRIRESMASLTPRFSANRAVRDYTERFYIPAAMGYIQRAGAGERTGLDMLQWRDDLERLWPHVHFGAVRTDTADSVHTISVDVYLGEIEPDTVRVELYAGPVNGGACVIEIMQKRTSPAGARGCYLYSASVAADRQASDYTPRIVPFHGLTEVPLEAADILWQH